MRGSRRGRSIHSCFRVQVVCPVLLALAVEPASSQTVGPVLLQLEGGIGTFAIEKQFVDGSAARRGVTPSWSIGGELALKIRSVILGARYMAYFGALDIVVGSALQWKLDTSELGGFAEWERPITTGKRFGAGGGVGVSRLSSTDVLGGSGMLGGYSMEGETVSVRPYALLGIGLSEHLQMRFRGGYAFADVGEVELPKILDDGSLRVTADHSGWFATLGIGRWF